MAKYMKSPLPLTYITIRKYVGILAMSLPIVISLTQIIFFQDGLRGSISAYYHTSMGWFFVSTLCFIGFFLVFLYQGYDNWDKVLALLAGIFAFTTAFLPTDPFRDDPAKQAIIHGFSQHTATTIHGGSALIMFFIVGVFILFRFPKCEHGRNNIFKQCEIDTKDKQKRNRVYRICGVVIFAAMSIMGLEMLLNVTFSPFTIFWGEFVILLSFGFAWAVKGEILWKDAIPSKDSKVFNKLQRRQIDGYKSGMWIFFLLIAIWFTVILFSAQTAPFPLFAQEKGADAEEVTNVVVDNQIPILGFTKSEAQNILTFIVFFLVVIVFYFILNNQVISLFWPLVRRNFRVDLGGSEAEKKEKGELWVLFSNQVNELGLSPGFSVNPRAETAISAPSTLTPDNSYLKTFFDLVNWIFPRLGYSMQMTKLESKKLGAGLSLAIAKNDRKENIAEKTFWASTYDIRNTDNENDLSVFRFLMIPAYFWFSDIVDRMDGFEPNEHTWEANANYHLGNSMWHTDIDKGINYYTNSINLDSENWPAFAALGRVWAEKSQDEKVEAFSKEYLLLANNYLKTSIDGLRTKELDEVYFGALYNQVVVLLYLLDDNMGNKELVSIKGNMAKKEALATLRIILNSLNQKTTNKKITHDELWNNKKILNHVLNLTEQTNNDELDSIKRSLRNVTYNDTTGEINTETGLIREELDLIGNLLNNDEPTIEQKMKDYPMGVWLVDYLQALEFVLQIIELPVGKFDTKEKIEFRLKNVISDFKELPCCKYPTNMDHPLRSENGRHFSKSHYRVQFNAACFYSTLVSKTKANWTHETHGTYKEYIINLALDHIEMALGVGGGLVEFAKKDSALEDIRGRERFKKITEGKIETKKEMDESKLHIVHYQEQKDEGIKQLPGMSEKLVREFADLGIITRNDLLLNGVDANSRYNLVKKTKADKKMLTWWLNLCDLMRVPGLTLEAAIALEDEKRGKVDTIKELQKRRADKLYTALGGIYPMKLIQSWIDVSKKLIPALEYD